MCRAGAIYDESADLMRGSHTVQALPDGVDDGQVVAGASTDQQVKWTPPVQLEEDHRQCNRTSTTTHIKIHIHVPG